MTTCNVESDLKQQDRESLQLLRGEVKRLRAVIVELVKQSGGLVTVSHECLSCGESDGDYLIVEGRPMEDKILLSVAKHK